jgi:hypothetical protein
VLIALGVLTAGRPEKKQQRVTLHCGMKMLPTAAKKMPPSGPEGGTNVAS